MDKILKEMRKSMLYVAAKGHDGNLQSCFSSLEIIWALYDRFLPLSEDGMKDENRSRFVLSKGQSNLALMTVLAQKGLIPKRELESFCQFESRIAMQADRTKFESIIESSAGSLGHGLPIATGMAWAKKIQNHAGQIYCLVGDGEMNEGTIWEAMLFASSERLDNLVLIIDDNHSVSNMIDMGHVEKKLISFGFDMEVIDGHNVSEISCALETTHDKPLAILAQTVRGYGCKTLMEDRSWFHRYPSEDELDILCKEVDMF